MLNFIFLTLGIGAGFGIVYGAELNLWWVLALIPAGTLAAFLLYVLFILLAAACMPPRTPKKSSGFCRLMIRWTMDWLMSVARVKVIVTGKEILPDEPCVLVCNHRSDFDPMTVLAVMKGRKITYISKAANFRIPVAGKFIRRAGFLAIDRENARRALGTLDLAAEKMKTEKTDIGIYPEGTRSKTGELLKFREGAYRLAKIAEAPIVVMTTVGSETVSANAPFKKSVVKIDFVEVVDRETVLSHSEKELAEMTRNTVEKHLAEISTQK